MEGQVKPRKAIIKNGNPFIVCSDGYSRAAAQLTCPVCGRKVWIRKTNIERKGQKFCSHSCANKGGRKSRGVAKKVIRCVICGRLKLVQRSKADRYKTCGRQRCHSIHFARMMKKRHKDGAIPTRHGSKGEFTPL